jgi:HSP20 family protein
MPGTVQKETRHETSHTEEYVTPEVNIFETKDGYVVEAEMAGVGKDGLEITLENNELTLLGHRSNESLQGQPLFRERRLADYRRVFELDPAVDSAKISAKMDQGILTLTLPKSERVKPRKITVD